MMSGKQLIRGKAKAVSAPTAHAVVTPTSSSKTKPATKSLKTSPSGDTIEEFNPQTPSKSSTLADLNDTEKEKMIRIVRELIVEKQNSQQLYQANAELTRLLAEASERSSEREHQLLAQIDGNKRNQESLATQSDDLTAKYGMSLGLLKLYQAKLNGFATAHRIGKIKVCTLKTCIICSSVTFSCICSCRRLS
jgi:hypothetical protein